MGGQKRREGSRKSTTKKYALETPTWPDACPTRHAEKIISIVAGNTHLNWAVHEGETNGFTPILFWRTPPLHPDEKNDDPCEVLARHLPPQAHAIVFGDQSAQATKANASAIAAMRRVPAITVFVISTNENHENAVGFLFEDVPSRIFKLRASDFFDVSSEPYPGMGVDRAATLRAAVTMHSIPSLVIDAGTALTYTGMDRHGKIIGGGICPGINSRFRSLHDYCGALPRIEFEEYKAFVEQMNGAGDVGPSVFAKDTKEQIMVNVFTEIAFKCRSAINHFLKIVGEGELSDDEDEEIEKEQANKEVGAADLSSDAMEITPINPDTVENGTSVEKAAAADKVPANTDNTAVAPAPTDTTAEEKEAEASMEPAPMETETVEAPNADTVPATEQVEKEPPKPENGDGSGAKATLKEPPKDAAPVAVEKMKKSTRIPSITLTGGDAAFLEMLLNLASSNLGPLSGVPTLPDKNKYELRSVKHLIHYGVSAVLSEKFKLYNIDDPDQELRQKLVGLRIAKEFDLADRDGDQIFRGSVLFIKSDEMKDKAQKPPLEADLFHIRYDDGDTEDITIIQLYHALVLYQKVGEKSAVHKLVQKEDIDRKKEQAAELSATLVKASEVVSKSKEMVEKELAEKEAKAAAAAEVAKAKRSSASVSSTATPVSSKKTKKNGPSPASSAAATPKVSKEAYIGKRVAKLFPMEDDSGKPIKVVYFGVIDKIVEDSDDSLWHVQYDDDDEEEYDEKDVKRALRLYEKEKGGDKKAAK